MKLNSLFILILILAGLFACTNNDEQKAQQHKLDSIRRADSIEAAIREQRVIDSVNMVSNEQQIISDSIQSQFDN